MSEPVVCEESADVGAQILGGSRMPQAILACAAVAVTQGG
jgi:hypothetical protein